MIVESMTHEEVYKEISKDTPELASWWNRTEKELAKAARKMMKFPISKWFKYVTRRRNTYFTTVRIMGRNFYRSNLYAVFAVRLERNGISVYFANFRECEREDRIVLIPHVFDRYRERFLKTDDAGTLEVIRKFLSRNVSGSVTTNNDAFGSSVVDSGRDNVCMCVSDGVLFGEETDYATVFRTFVTYDMSLERQEKYFKHGRSRVMSAEDLINSNRNI